ncbi:unnamed protein product [Ectocarpus fasciculatus]
MPQRTDETANDRARFPREGVSNAALKQFLSKHFRTKHVDDRSSIFRFKANIPCPSLVGIRHAETFLSPNDAGVNQTTVFPAVHRLADLSLRQIHPCTPMPPP